MSPSKSFFNRTRLSLACLVTGAGLGLALASGSAGAQSSAASASAPAASALGGDADIQAKAAMCMGCHNIPQYKASFPEIHQVPKLGGQNAKYIESALNAYKKGERKHPSMRAIAASLNDKDIAALAAFYAQQGNANDVPAKPEHEPSAQVAALLKKANCVSCHGENFSKPIDPSYPKIAGQHADYLYVALKAYQTDNSAQVGRGNAIMAGMAKQYTHAELKQLADYIGSLPTNLQTVAQPRFR